jgi:ubiquinone/menaquinone biosynthesis C-methylase UbiE
MGLPVSLLVRLNRGHFKYKPPKDDPVQYARWEFNEGKRVWERFFASRVDLAGKDILDLGCGPGGKTCYLATQKPRRVVGVDYSAELLGQAEAARDVLVPPENRLIVEFACVNASDLPFPEAYFDVVTCSDAFEHFNDPRKVISEAARVIKPGGLLTIDFAQWGSYNGHHLGDFFKTPWVHVFWSEQDVVEAVNILAQDEKYRLHDEASSVAIDNLVARRIGHFHTSLNRLRLSDFERSMSEEKSLKVRWRKRTAAHLVLWPFIYIPGIRELTVARNVYILEKVTTRR